MVAAAILGYEEQKRQIDAEIAELRAMESETEPSSSGSESTPTRRPRRKMSAATRKAMALAQQKRWAAKKTAVSEPDATAVAKPKRKLSAAGKKRIIAASKRYWAEKRAAAKKSS
jgi:hypothetical protein